MEVRTRKLGVAVPQRLLVAGLIIVALVGWGHLVVSLGKDVLEVVSSWRGKR
jgi:hypothetical protein